MLEESIVFLRIMAILASKAIYYLVLLKLNISWYVWILLGLAQFYSDSSDIGNILETLEILSFLAKNYNAANNFYYQILTCLGGAHF